MSNYVSGHFQFLHLIKIFINDIWGNQFLKLFRWEQEANNILNKYTCSGLPALNVKDTTYTAQSNQKLFHHYQHVNVIQSTGLIHKIIL